MLLSDSNNMTNRWFRFQRFNLYRLRISVWTKSKSTKKHGKNAEIGKKFVLREEAKNQLKKRGSIYQQIKGSSIHKMALHIKGLFQDSLPLGLYFGVTYTTWWTIGSIFSKQCAWIYRIYLKYNPHNEEEFVVEYLSEIESLKKDVYMYWSNTPAQLWQSMWTLMFLDDIYMYLQVQDSRCPLFTSIKCNTIICYI